ncbi:DgyrCDS5137 [Dimorphilus gyrociliatus]|uniref:DgyrCDS5137 n=1 Tax=Dimorphilus gyrociliatus TaxID=2664684 RepID=A0A7I8VJ35_9ANNE|nr:DgyrCDS5137 [Dimorphilus gyrociliatus]
MAEKRIENLKSSIKDPKACPIKYEEKSMELDMCASSLSDCINMKQDQKMIRYFTEKKQNTTREELNKALEKIESLESALKMEKKDLDIFCSEEKEMLKQLKEELKAASKKVEKKDVKRTDCQHELEQHKMMVNGMKQLVDFQLPETEKERNKLKEELEELRKECSAKPSKPSKGCLEEKEMIKQLRQELNSKDDSGSSDDLEMCRGELEQVKMMNSGMDQLIKYQLPETEKERDQLKQEIEKMIEEEKNRSKTWLFFVFTTMILTTYNVYQWIASVVEKNQKTSPRSMAGKKKQ